MMHYEFISKTDNKSLFSQIKYLVDCGKESYQNDLARRRERLRELLEEEERVYENEFMDKTKSRVDENIRQRQEALQAIKKERTAEREKFVASKKLHQNMLNCLDIRDELRKKDYREIQICQLKQMDDKLRAIQQEKKDEEFWFKVQKKMNEKADEMQEQEEDLKKSLQANQCKVLRSQLEEHRETKELDLKHLDKEKKTTNSKLIASQSEEKQKTLADRTIRSQELKMSLNKISEQQNHLRKEAEAFENVFHAETMRQVNKQIEDTVQTNAKLKEDTLDYLRYIKKFKAFVAEQDRKRDELGEESDKRFHCYKNQSRRGLVAQKRHAAEVTHKALLKQICEEQARRIKLEKAERENKMTENRFARIEVRDKLKTRHKINKDLDDQLAELDLLKQEKQKQFENELNRAEEDQLYCEKLLEKLKIEGCDYLPPHPNWKLLACFKDNDCIKGKSFETK